MKDLLENIVKYIVDNPDDVSVSEVEGEQSIILEIRVHPDDMGKVIGRQGRIAKALRTVMKSAVNKGNKRVVVEILE